MALPGVMVVRLGGGPTLHLLEDGARGAARATIWPSLGARARSLVHFRLSAGASTVELRHDGEGVHYVIAGSGTVQQERGAPSDLTEGSVVHAGPKTSYRFVAGEAGLELVGGPCPPDPAWFGHLDGAVPDADGSTDERGTEGEDATEREPGTVTVLHRDEPELMLPIISSDARMIAWPGNDAWDATLNYVRMAPGEENRPHAHPRSEDTIVILDGKGSVDNLDSGETYEFSAGDVIHVAARVRHAVRANRGSAVVSVGGPSPADIGFLRACGAQLPDTRPG